MSKLRTSAFGSLAVALVGVTTSAWWLRIQLQLSPRFPALVAIVFVAVMLLAIGALLGTRGALLGRVPSAHPFDRFGPANQTTTVRVALVAIVAGLLFERPTPHLAAAAAALAGFAVILDGLDGWLARTSGKSSAFGARFDLEVDALLIMALAMLAWQHDKAGAWILLSGLLRYLFITSGLLWHWLRQPLPPSLRRQTICVIQIVGLMVAVLPIVRPPVSTAVAAVSLAVLCYSFLVDTLWLWRNAP
jgi:phosphatidylglycerophosphate synthase